ncbi:MAG: dihydrofolate reductase [Bacteroidetes bacterium]|nr:MAG: dihydrofolate reductase [Bacteroidota bacterium]
MKNISIIVAIAKNYAIGKNNELLWHISDDLKRFKKYTTGNVVIMGRNTFLSLPKGALPNRQNIVITDDKNDKFNGADVVFSIDEAIEKASNEKDNFIIGGGMIYKQFLPIANKLYLTQINKEFDADTFFPEINFDEWKLEYEEFVEKSDKNEFSHSFKIFSRIK